MFTFFSGIPYVISVVTGDRQNAGTDANVFIVLHNGKKKLDSGKVWLSDGKFKRGMTQIFHINLQVMLSPLTSLEIGHDNSGAAAGWFCEQVIVFCPNTGIEQNFPCHKWLSTSDGDGLIQRTLYENTGLRKKKDKSKLNCSVKFNVNVLSTESLVSGFLCSLHVLSTFCCIL